MKQYIDKSAVLAEIKEMLQKEYPCDNSEQEAGYDFALYELQDLLNTLEVKEDTISNEPLISSELLTASADYARKQLANPDYPTYNDEYELLCAFEAGANWQKEQIMKDAIEREVKDDAGGYPYIDATELYDYDNDKPLAKAGDKVKVIIMTRE